MILLELFFRVTKWGPLTHALIIEQGSPLSYSDLWYEIHGPKFGSEFQTGPTGDEGNRGRMFLRLWRNLGGLELSRRLEVGNYVGGIRRFVCVGRGSMRTLKYFSSNGQEESTSPYSPPNLVPFCRQLLIIVHVTTFQWAPPSTGIRSWIAFTNCPLNYRNTLHLIIAHEDLKNLNSRVFFILFLIFYRVDQVLVIYVK